MAETGGNKLHKKCRINVHSRTFKLSDPDGRSAKAALDGLREGGLLEDDSAEFIESISQSQEKTKDDEETIIDIYWDHDLFEKPKVSKIERDGVI